MWKSKTTNVEFFIKKKKKKKNSPSNFLQFIKSSFYIENNQTSGSSKKNSFT